MWRVASGWVSPKLSGRGVKMTANEFRELRSYPRHFELDGVPVCVASKASLPQVYVGAGAWETVPASFRLFIHGKLITAKRFEDLCQHVDQLIDRGPPFLDAAEA